MRIQKLGVGFQFSKKACFVCGSFSHLIKDCDFHDKKMVQKHVLKTVEKKIGQKEVRPVWNHAMRVNHQNFSNSRRNFAPTAVLTKSGIIPISTARQSSSRVAASVSTARPINTAAPKPIVNVAKSRQNACQKTHSLSRRPFHKQTSLKNRYLVNTAKVKSVNTVYTAKRKSMTSDVRKQGSNAVKSSACWVWRPKIKTIKNMMEDLLLLQAVLKEVKENQEKDKIGSKPDKKGSGNLVRGLPSKFFENDQTCVACKKGKQNKAACKSKLVNSVSQPLQILHMDLFGPTFIKSIIGKMYFLVVTHDYSRFSWVFFLAKKDKTCGILKDFITGIENQLNHKVKIIRCDNGTEFKNYEMNQFCGIKGIKREFSNARTPQQNGVVKRKNRTLIEAARTMLADSLLPIPFWAEAVNIACYVQNRIKICENDVFTFGIRASEQVKTMKIQTGIQVSRPRDLRRQLQLWKRFGRLHLIIFVLVRNICKKQIVVATSSTEAEYVAAASCCAQVLWIQNQLLDYWYNFMHTIIYIDNSSTICIIKNQVLHSKTKHIEIRHHFIRDCNEKKLIQVIKIPTENNFADLLTKAFDVGRF
nr:putative ribonuclease H-like domain-containing protein [Tanacetum cinerariifolium]